MRITSRSLSLLLALSVLGVTGCNDDEHSESNVAMPISIQATLNGQPTAATVRTAPGDTWQPSGNGPAAPGEALAETPPAGLDPNLIPGGEEPVTAGPEGSDFAQPMPPLEEASASGGRLPLEPVPAIDGGIPSQPAQLADGGIPPEPPGGSSAPSFDLEERSRRATGMTFSELVARQRGTSEAQRRLQAQRALELAEGGAIPRVDMPGTARYIPPGPAGM